MAKKVLYMGIISPAESGVGVSSKIYKQMNAFRKRRLPGKALPLSDGQTRLKKISFHFYAEQPDTEPCFDRRVRMLTCFTSAISSRIPI